MVMTGTEIHSDGNATQAAPAKDPQNKEANNTDTAKKSKKSKVAASGEGDFSGTIESIGVKNHSGNGLQLHFRLSGRKASKNVYTLDNSDPAAFSAMLHLMTSAFKKECKIRGRSISASTGEIKVLEFEIKS